jgi:hypothetical protein
MKKNGSVLICLFGLVLLVSAIFVWPASRKEIFIAGAIDKTPASFVRSATPVWCRKNILVDNATITNQEFHGTADCSLFPILLQYELGFEPRPNLEAIAVHNKSRIRQKDWFGVIWRNGKIVGSINKTMRGTTGNYFGWSPTLILDDNKTHAAVIFVAKFDRSTEFRCNTPKLTPLVSIMSFRQTMNRRHAIIDTHGKPSSLRVDDGLGIDQRSSRSVLSGSRSLGAFSGLFGNGYQGQDGSRLYPKI